MEKEIISNVFAFPSSNPLCTFQYRPDHQRQERLAPHYTGIQGRYKAPLPNINPLLIRLGLGPVHRSGFLPYLLRTGLSDPHPPILKPLPIRHLQISKQEVVGLEKSPVTTLPFLLPSSHISLPAFLNLIQLQPGSSLYNIVTNTLSLYK